MEKGNNMRYSTESDTKPSEVKCGIMRRALSMMLAAALVLAPALPVAYSDVYAATDTGQTVDTPQDGSDDVVVKETTTLSDYNRTINKRLSQNVKVKVRVYPATGTRKVRLQRYDSSIRKYKTVKTYYTDDALSDTVTMTIDKEYRQRTTSYWRINVTETKTAKAANSKRITLTTRNIDPPSLSARAAVIYRVDDNNGDGTLIYTKNSTTKRAQASTTKLMTAVLLMESGKINTKTKISKHAAQTPWSGHFVKGDTYRTKDLLYALLMPSANDAATALAEKVGGSESKFVKMMNKKAAAMGLTNTSFRNPHGLDADGHYTTAKDLAKLTAVAYRYPLISDAWNTKVKTIKSIKKKRRWTLWTTNAIFGYDSNFRGGKTGTTGNAACCFTGVYEYKGETYVTTVLGSGYGFTRWADTKKLHKYIKQHAATYY